MRMIPVVAALKKTNLGVLTQLFQALGPAQQNPPAIQHGPVDVPPIQVLPPVHEQGADRRNGSDRWEEDERDRNLFQMSQGCFRSLSG